MHESPSFWHGSGRYKYVEGEVVDVLKEILCTASLVPYIDIWDQKRQDVHSISVAPSRSYARLYASLFYPASQRSLGELWKRFAWSCRYLLPSIWIWLREYGLRPFIIDHKTKTSSWIAKLSTKPQSLFYLFLWGGTDITTNYPILIGIRPGAYATTSGSRFVDLYEDRIVEPIPIKNFTHIEVPTNRVQETLNLIRSAGYMFPAIALEKTG